MADIGAPVKRHRVVPLTEPVEETREPKAVPVPVREPAKEEPTKVPAQ